MPLDLLGEIHSSTGVASGDWRTFREEVTGMYLLSGGLSGPMPDYLLILTMQDTATREQEILEITLKLCP